MAETLAQRFISEKIKPGQVFKCADTAHWKEIVSEPNKGSEKVESLILHNINIGGRQHNAPLTTAWHYGDTDVLLRMRVRAEIDGKKERVFILSLIHI